MLALTQPIRSVRPSHTFGIFLFLFFGLYLGLLFVVGALAALLLAMFLFTGKSRVLLGFGGGFSGLAAWFTVMLNHKDPYEQVVAFLAKHMTQNWAVFLTDSFICVLGAAIFVILVSAARGTIKRVVATVTGRKTIPKDEKMVEPAAV